MKRLITIAAVAAALLLAGAGCPSGNQTGTGAPSGAVGAPSTGPGAGEAAAGPRMLVVSMRPKGGDDEIGNVVLTEVDKNHTRVTITLANAPTNTAEDAGIFGGDCKDLGAALQYDLGTVVKGRSSTVLNVNFGSFVGGTKQSVRVRTEPVDPSSTYWTCGDIR